MVYTGGGMPAPDAAQKAELAAWQAWYGKLDCSSVDGENPSTPMAKSIASDGRVSDGPIGTMASGYSVIKADSLNKAVALAKGCPVLKSGAKITVYETFDAAGI